MTSSPSTKDLLTRLDGDNVKMGDIKKMAKEIKVNHESAMELWRSGHFHARMLAVLIMDKKQLNQDIIHSLARDLELMNEDQRIRIADWLLANQLTKNHSTIALLQSWEKAEPPILRRLFWYYQARLRWMGKAPPGNSPELMDSLEADLVNSEPEVQWAMNFAAAQIGIHEPAYRARCISLGETLGLYKDERVSRGCTPNYLPEFIRIEVAKLSG